MSKKKIALIVLGVFVLLLGVLVGIIASRPAAFSVSRSIVINAQADRIFPYFNNTFMGLDWSPFEKLNPDMKREFSFQTEGVGATYAWAGNADAGQGKMTIIESEPDKRVRLQLDFIRPFEATNFTEYRIESAGENSQRVTWEMTGNHNFMGKAVCMIMDMDKAVGAMFEEGLTNLKHLVETPPHIVGVKPMGESIDVVVARHGPYTCELVVDGEGKGIFFYLPNSPLLMHPANMTDKRSTHRLIVNGSKFKVQMYRGHDAPAEMTLKGVLMEREISRDSQARIELLKQEPTIAAGVQEVVIGSVYENGKPLELRFRIVEMTPEHLRRIKRKASPAATQPAS